MKIKIFFEKITGGFFVAVGLLINPWSLLFISPPSDGSISSEAKFFIFFCEFISVMIGVCMLASGTIRRRIFIFFLTIVLMFIGLEVGLQLIARARRGPVFQLKLISSGPQSDSTQESSRLSESINLTRRLVPYVGYVDNEFHGQFINVDAQGSRKTWNPDPIDGVKPKTVYVFGGSTTFGYGADDESTIPSFLSKLLNKNGHRYQVHNYGTNGSTFTAQVVRLTMLLRDGHRPDYVIFYGGANEVVAGSGGHPEKVRDFEMMFHNEMPNYTMLLLRAGFFGAIRENSLTYKSFLNMKNQFSNFIRSNRARSMRENQAEDYVERENQVEDYVEEDVELFSRAIADYYLGTKDLLDHLAIGYGFQHTYFWQPNAFVTKKLHPQDKATILPFANQFFEDLHNRTIAILNSQSVSYFYDLSDVLDDANNPVYLDWCHTSEQGNEIISQRIYDIFIKYSK